MMVGNQRLELVASDQLLTLLNQLQPTFDAQATDAEDSITGQVQNLSESVGSLLQEQSSTSTLRAIDRESSDIINLLTYLYEEIGKDMTVPIPIKELIGRTQITVLKIALEDSGFFDAAAHPARLFLNELASASLSWTESEKLGQDPVYRKMQELVTRFVRNFSGDMALVEALLGDLIAFENEFADANQEKEQKLLDEDERKHRLEEVEQYALDKIDERIRDKDISPFVQSFLKTHFHKFVVQVLLREGPGGIIWRPIMNTIDVLLWTVSTEKQEGDLQRFAKANLRLLLDLGKALEVAGIEKPEAEESLGKLKRVQEACFETPPAVVSDEDVASVGVDNEKASLVKSTTGRQEPLNDDDEHLQEVSNYPIGIWLEFEGGAEQAVRCTLAAKIDTIGKYVFVNGQGVKVIEKSKWD